MRKTTINISDDLDKNIEELLSLTDHGNFTRVIEAAVYNYLRMVQSSGNYWPTYTLDKVWVDAEAADEQAIDVFMETEDGVFGHRLRKVESMHELLEDRPFYVEVKSDDLIYPRALYDFEEVKPGPEQKDFWRFVGYVGVTPENWRPKYFQRAGLVATPQLGLI